MSRWVHNNSQELIRAALGEWFGLGREYIEVLHILYEAAGDWISAEDMRSRISSHRRLSKQAVYERISVLRSAVDAESIDSGGQLDPSGYRLTEIGFDECRRALGSMAAVLQWRSVGEEPQ